MDLKKHIKAFHTRSDSTYGAPRIWKDLMDMGIRVSKKRVARLMRGDDHLWRFSPQEHTNHC